MKPRPVSSPKPRYPTRRQVLALIGGAGLLVQGCVTRGKMPVEPRLLGDIAPTAPPVEQVRDRGEIPVEPNEVKSP